MAHQLAESCVLSKMGRFPNHGFPNQGFPIRDWRCALARLRLSELSNH
jgi:hypothetical protein